MRTALLLIMCCAAAIVAQSNQWPLYFAVPQIEGRQGDSGKLAISSNAKVFQGYEGAKTSLNWQPKLHSTRLQQKGIFETTRDETEDTSDAIGQFVDFSGNLVKDSVISNNGSMGIEWKPVTYFDLRNTKVDFQVTGDLGPFYEYRLHEVPFRLRGGVSGNSWSDSLPKDILQSGRNDVRSDIGFYGAADVGDSTRKFFGQPLYLHGQAFARSISQAGLAVMTGSALYAHGIGSGDSLFAYYGDSLSNGKEGFWGSAGGRQQYSNTPWRIARSFLAAGGIKAKERVGFQPAVVYSYAEHSVAYPTQTSVLSDVCNRMQSLNFQLRTRDALPLYYCGGITFSWGDEEWLFNSDLSALASSRYIGPSSPQLDSLQVKLGDHDRYKAMMDNDLGVWLPGNILLEYRLSAFRDSRTYTFRYINEGDIVDNNNDDDRITFNHHAGVSINQFRGWDAQLYGEYSIYTLNYLREEQSAQNYTEDRYRVGMNLAYRPSERFFFDERIAADAEITDYFYKHMHRDPFDPPPYHRRLSSIFTSEVRIADGWEVHGRWLEYAYDQGRWYGHEYRKNDSLKEGSDFYAVEITSIEHSVELSLCMIRDRFRFESGCFLRDIFDREFRGSEYVNGPNDRGYYSEPFIDVRFAFRNFSLTGRIARMFNTEADDNWVLRNNWDITVRGTASW